MPHILPFAHTIEAVLDNAKTETRRVWQSPRLEPGTLVKAYDMSPRNGGQHVANIFIWEIFKQNTAHMLDIDYFAEGLDYMENIKPGHRFNIPPYGYTFEDFIKWRTSAQDVTVIRFTLVDITICHWRASGLCCPKPAYSCLYCKLWRET